MCICNRQQEQHTQPLPAASATAISCRNYSSFIEAWQGEINCSLGVTWRGVQAVTLAPTAMTGPGRLSASCEDARQQAVDDMKTRAALPAGHMLVGGSAHSQQPWSAESSHVLILEQCPGSDG